MPTVCIQMATHSVLDAIPEHMATTKLFTQIKWAMYNYKDQPDGYNRVESQSKRQNSTKPTETEIYYATIISMAMDYLLGPR